MRAFALDRTQDVRVWTLSNTLNQRCNAAEVLRQAGVVTPPGGRVGRAAGRTHDRVDAQQDSACRVAFLNGPRR